MAKHDTIEELENSYTKLVNERLDTTDYEAVADGKFHRFEDPEKGKRNKNCYAMLTPDGTFGVYGNWATDEKYLWFGDAADLLDAVEIDEADKKLERAFRQRSEERDGEQQGVADYVRYGLLPEAADPRPDYPYLKRKGIAPANARQYGERLLIPLQNAEGDVRTLQQIYPDGAKRFLPSGEVTGNFSLIGTHELPRHGKLIVCEGWATGVTLHTQHGCPVAAAMNAGNLVAAARALRARLPDAVELIIAADDDRQTPNNPGLAAALLAGKLTGATLLTPAFPCSDCSCTDFNDLAACLRAQEQPPPKTPAVSVEDAPLPLESALPPAPPFTMAMLPEGFVGFVASTAERMQVPPDYVAVTALGVAAGIVGARVQIHPKQRDSWRVVPTLWAAMVGPPSTMKSPVLSAALAPLRTIEAELLDAYEKERLLHDIAAELAETGIKDVKKEAAKLAATNRAKAVAMVQGAMFIEPEPTLRRYIINDSTVEKFGEIMGENPNGMLQVRDELSGWLAKMGSEEYATDRSFYLECFNGTDPYVYDRIGRGTVRIERCVLSIVGGIQPAKLTTLVDGAIDGHADDGLLQRFQLAVWPETPRDWEWIDQEPDQASLDRYADTLRALHDLPIPEGDADPPILRFTTEAQELFREWMTRVNRRARSEDMHPVLASHLLKMPKTIASLALLFELIDGGWEAVGKEATERALLWADYLFGHAQRIYAVANHRRLDAARLIWRRRDKLPAIFSSRDVQRKSWEGLTTGAKVRGALEQLVDAGYLEAISVKPDTRGGRPTVRYRWLASGMTSA
jgi:putative DNA primase/helicase